MQFYIIQVRHGYIVETLEPQTSWARKPSELERKNIHNVMKAHIKTMLDRYESNISGEKLIKMFQLEYPQNNIPPQFRKNPPIAVNTTKKIANRSSSQNNKKVVQSEIDNKPEKGVIKRHEAFLRYSNKIEENETSNKETEIPKPPRQLKQPKDKNCNYEEKEFASFEDISKTLSDLKALSNFDYETDKPTNPSDPNVSLQKRKDSFENNGSKSENNVETSPLYLNAIGSEKKQGFHTLANDLQLPLFPNDDLDTNIRNLQPENESTDVPLLLQSDVTNETKVQVRIPIKLNQNIFNTILTLLADSQ